MQGAGGFESPLRSALSTAGGEQAQQGAGRADSPEAGLSAEEASALTAQHSRPAPRALSRPQVHTPGARCHEELAVSTFRSILVVYIYLRYGTAARRMRVWTRQSASDRFIGVSSLEPERDPSEMSDRDRSSPSLLDTPLKTYIGRHDDDYPLISGNGECSLLAQCSVFTASYDRAPHPTRAGRPCDHS